MPPDNQQDSVIVVFVCLGNICRSPSAQGVFEKFVADAALAHRIAVDSCGTAAFNVGKPPDPRAVAACQRKGYDISGQIARQINETDFANAHYIVPMDNINAMNIKGWAPEDFAGEINNLMYYAGRGRHSQLPDPYYDDAEKFDRVVTAIEKACHGLLKTIRNEHQL